MKCPYCGRKVCYSPALKGALRKGPIERTCTRCGRVMVVKPGDITDPVDMHLQHKPPTEDKPIKRWKW